ncbi:hypothetical protein, partial [Pseudomonas sp. SIMBA_044]|uniref:hypothetical protein n=1 Tax=Pseudomonas sp. SIMBA_044 TaxID=3085785 RepID=UPI0039794B71
MSGELCIIFKKTNQNNMYTKYCILIIFFFFYSASGQLKLEVRLINSIANVTISNNSKEYYVLPIDIYHLRPYEGDCGSFS